MIRKPSREAFNRVRGIKDVHVDRHDAQCMAKVVPKIQLGTHELLDAVLGVAGAVEAVQGLTHHTCACARCVLWVLCCEAWQNSRTCMHDLSKRAHMYRQMSC
jgi:hypothetical protein